MKPLSGIRVVELVDAEREYCGKLLADLGAHVIKVEPPWGSPSRYIPPFQSEKNTIETSYHFAFYNSNKGSVTLDWEEPFERELLIQLVKTSDVLIDGFDPTIVEKHLGCFSKMKREFPELIIASITGFGQTGPYAHWQAPEIVPFAMGGLMYVSGDPNLPPVVAPGNASYNMASVMAAIGILIALWKRKDSGKGERIDVSAHESMALSEHIISHFSETGRSLARTGSQHQTAVPGRVYRCKDGFIHIMISDAQLNSWLRFVDWLGNPPELLDERLRDTMYRRKHAKLVDRVFSEFAATRTKEELVHEAQKRRLPCIAVNSPIEFMQHEHNVARGFFETITHPILGTFRTLGAPYRMDASPISPGRAPLLGENNEDILVNELGISPSELSRMLERHRKLHSERRVDDREATSF